MRAIARQREKYTHDVKAGDHTLTVDESVQSGGDDFCTRPPYHRPVVPSSPFRV